MSKNKIPANFSEGLFSALEPFNKVCKDDVFYRVTATRTLDDFLRDGLNVQTLVFDPAEVNESNANAMMRDLDSSQGVIVTLAPLNGASIHIPSTYFKSFPLVDGVRLERLVIYGDLGACTENIKDQLNVLTDNLKETITTTVGIASPTVSIGTVQTRSYVSQEQFELMEINRLKNITQSKTLVGEVNRLEEELAKEKAYSRMLEEKIKDLSK